MYRSRHLEWKLAHMARLFKVVLLTGARQVGKSTLLGHAFPQLKKVTFDASMDSYGAQADPVRFLNHFRPPIILDEIQYVPQLLAPMKRYVDERDEKGQYFLTSSQQLSMIKNAAESMAGRVGILELSAFSVEEWAGVSSHLLTHYLNEPDALLPKFKGFLPLSESLYELMWRGLMPELLDFETEWVSQYHRSYIQTYLERDVRLLENVQDLTEFSRFVALMAALVAQEVNYTQLGRELGIARATAHRWLQILKSTYQWHEIPPYAASPVKRISQKSKGFMADTGLVCTLLRLSSPEALAAHPMLGAVFENFVVMNLIKNAQSGLTPPAFYHWRTTYGAEVDLILERDGFLYPIEIKCKGSVNRSDARGLKSFREAHPHQTVRPGLVIYAGNECFALDDQTWAVPWNAFWEA